MGMLVLRKLDVTEWPWPREDGTDRRVCDLFTRRRQKGISRSSWLGGGMREFNNMARGSRYCDRGGNTYVEWREDTHAIPFFSSNITSAPQSVLRHQGVATISETEPVSVLVMMSLQATKTFRKCMRVLRGWAYRLSRGSGPRLSTSRRKAAWECDR
jgi:hypothetical protein